MSGRRRKGPTPRRKAPRLVWLAECECCGAHDTIDRGDSPPPLNHTPCPSCGYDCARYVEAAL